MAKNKIKSKPFRSGENIKSVNDLFDKWYTSDDRHLAFSFTKMPEGKYNVESILDNKLLALLLKRLKKLSTMTWKEIKQCPRHGAGFESIEKRSINGKLPQSITEDTDIIVFRYLGKKEMAGYRSGKIFHILFVDQDFSLYNHG